MPALRPLLTRLLAGAAAAPWHRWTHSVRTGGRWHRGDAHSGDRDGPSLPPCAEFLTVGEAHKVAVPRILKVRITIEGADDGLTFSARMPHGGHQLSVRNVVPTLTSNKRCGLFLDGRC
jgi:hypothetical protein